MAYAAARLVGLSCNNTLGALKSDLVIMDDDEIDPSMAATSFVNQCQGEWERVRKDCETSIYDLTKEERWSSYSLRASQAAASGMLLEQWRKDHSDSVQDLLREVQ